MSGIQIYKCLWNCHHMQHPDKTMGTWGGEKTRFQNGSPRQVWLQRESESETKQGNPQQVEQLKVRTKNWVIYQEEEQKGNQGKRPNVWKNSPATRVRGTTGKVRQIRKWRKGQIPCPGQCLFRNKYFLQLAAPGAKHSEDRIFHYLPLPFQSGMGYG